MALIHEGKSFNKKDSVGISPRYVVFESEKAYGLSDVPGKRAKLFIPKSICRYELVRGHPLFSVPQWYFDRYSEEIKLLEEA